MRTIWLSAALAALLTSGCCLMDWTRSRPSLVPVDKARDIIASRAKDGLAPETAGDAKAQAVLAAACPVR